MDAPCDKPQPAVAAEQTEHRLTLLVDRRRQLDHQRVVARLRNARYERIYSEAILTNLLERKYHKTPSAITLWSLSLTTNRPCLTGCVFRCWKFVNVVNEFSSM